MCTAITYQAKDHYFGRNLDLEKCFAEEVVITPRNKPLIFRHEKAFHAHYAMIGMAAVFCDYPLYYDATNEHGLSMAALNFPGNAKYFPVCNDKINISPFEFIPWILCQCKTTHQAEKVLSNLNLADTPFGQELPLSPLHWIIADKNKALTIETVKDGLKIYDNPVGVLTNNPPFDYHLWNLVNYLNVTSEEARNRFAPNYEIHPYSRGMGSIGLPGDLSSASRFVKAAFTKLNSHAYNEEGPSVGQFFHILGSVYQQEGCVKVGDAYEKTIYSSCCNTDKGIYYYTTYENSQITGISLFHKDLNQDTLFRYPLQRRQQIRWEN